MAFSKLISKLKKEQREDKAAREKVLADKQSEIDALNQQLLDMERTPEESEQDRLNAQLELKEVPIGQEIQTPESIGQAPSVPDAQEGLAPDVSTGDASAPFVTSGSDIQQLNTNVAPITTAPLEVPTLESGSVEASAVSAPTDVNAATYDAAQAQQLISESEALSGLPQGTAAKLLAGVTVEGQHTVDGATQSLQASGVDPTLSAQIATDPTGAADTVVGLDIESRSNIADLPEEALVSTQINGLLAGMESGEVPLWAKPAVDSVNAMMRARGLDTSTVGRDALFTAIVQSALPIAQGNAQALQQRAAQKLDAAVTFKTQEAQFEQQMALANLSNAQQAFIQSRAFSQETLLSNAAAENASRQFNATSENQINQFMTQLRTQTEQFNAQSENAMKQFNMTEQNRLAALDAGNVLQAEQFRAQQEFEAQRFQEQQALAREQWNATNAQAVEQSNITWRRNTNTAYTAAFNAANQQNVQNAYNITALEQTQLWQALRDEATYLRQAYESEQQRKTALYQTVLGNEKSMSGTAGTSATATGNRDAIADWLNGLEF